MITLSIDTTNNKVTKLVLQKNSEKFEVIKEYEKPQADQVLIEIEKLMKKTQTRPTDLQKIIVHRGPGSYTGIRVGLTIANTFAFALKIPVNDKQVGEYETALYE